MSVIPKLTLVWRFIRTNPSIVYSILLLIIVPAVLIGYAWWATSSFQQIIDVQLQRKAQLAHQTVATFIANDLTNPAQLQARLQQLKRNIGSDVVDYAIAEPNLSGRNFTITAGFDPSSIDAELTDPQYALAWQQQASFGTVLADPNTGQRLLLVTEPVYDAGGDARALATITLSLAETDQLISSLLFRSLIILIVAVLVVVLLIANHARLFSYAATLHHHEELDQLKNDFLAVAVHELRTPVTGLKSFLSILEEGDLGQLSEKGMKFAHQASGHAEQLNQLINHMLDVDRLEQGKEKFNLQVTDPLKITESVVEQLQFKAREKGLQLTLTKDPVNQINVDREHFRRIITNLIGNSIKYTTQGSVDVKLIEPDRGHVTISVRDTGVGIPPEKVDTLFKKFSRVHSEETAKIQGTGLGLWITKALVEHMDGKIYASSIHGQGTELTITFPIAKHAA